jgi:hypothetical protein
MKEVYSIDRVLVRVQPGNPEEIRLSNTLPAVIRLESGHGFDPDKEYTIKVFEVPAEKADKSEKADKKSKAKE